MTNAKLSELERLAKAATPGPWTTDARNCDIVIRVADGFDIAESQRISNSNNDATYIAAVNPAAILELIAELRHLQNYANTLAEELLWARNHIDTLEVGMEGIIDKNRILERGMHKGVV